MHKVCPSGLQRRQKLREGDNVSLIKGVQQGVQIVLVVLDLAAEPPQGLRQAAHHRQPLHRQYREDAQLRPAQEVAVVDSFQQVTEGEIDSNALQRRLRYRRRRGRLRLTQQGGPVIVQSLQCFQKPQAAGEQRRRCRTLRTTCCGRFMPLAVSRWEVRPCEGDSGGKRRLLLRREASC